MNLVSSIRRAKNWLRGAKFRVERRVEYELEEGEIELRLLPILADPDRDFLDVGANHGVYAYYALPHFRKVHAVEAHPGLVASLRAVIEPKGAVLAAALSDEQGSATLWIPVRDREDITSRSSLEADANPGFDLREVEVPMTTIDSLGLDRVGVIKIDVEGHEFAVLRGASATLRTAKPLCIVECEERHNPGGVARAFKFFADHGYKSYFLHDDRLRDGDDFDIDTLQRGSTAKVVGAARSSDYINNFIFAHPDNASGIDRIRRRYPA